MKPDFEKTVKIFKAYLDNENLSITKKEYLDNLISKTEDPFFQNDILPLIRNSSEYNVKKAFDFVKNKYITHI